LPLITPEVESRLYAAIAAKCRELKAEPLAVGGVDDHIHLLVRLPTALAIATLAKQVKGSSSHLITHEVTPGAFFRWQGAYGAFSLSQDQVKATRAHIERQREHHAIGDLLTEWEQCEEII